MYSYILSYLLVDEIKLNEDVSVEGSDSLDNANWQLASILHAENSAEEEFQL